MDYSTDPEKNEPQVTTVRSHTAAVEGTMLERHRVTDQVDNLADVEAANGWFGSLLKYASVLRVEERGIERVREEDRVKQSVFDGFTLWASANFT